MIHSRSQMHFIETAAWFASFFRKKHGLRGVWVKFGERLRQSPWRVQSKMGAQDWVPCFRGSCAMTSCLQHHRESMPACQRTGFLFRMNPLPPLKW
jgi:hypothetical protein